jgi:hypothetical protein
MWESRGNVWESRAYLDAGVVGPAGGHVCVVVVGLQLRRGRGWIYSSEIGPSHLCNSCPGLHSAYKGLPLRQQNRCDGGQTLRNEVRCARIIMRVGVEVANLFAGDTASIPITMIPPTAESCIKTSGADSARVAKLSIVAAVFPVIPESNGRRTRSRSP